MKIKERFERRVLQKGKGGYDLKEGIREKGLAMRERFGEKGITMGLEKGGKVFSDAFC